MSRVWVRVGEGGRLVRWVWRWQVGVVEGEAVMLGVVGERERWILKGAVVMVRGEWGKGRGWIWVEWFERAEVGRGDGGVWEGDSFWLVGGVGGVGSSSF